MNREADSLTARWLAASKNDLGQSFAIGLALADAGRFERADAFFTQALALAPADFNVLFNLGVVVWRTGNYQRAREVLEAARRQQPQNVDVLYNLAGVDHDANRNESAVALLAQAARPGATAQRRAETARHDDGRLGRVGRFAPRPGTAISTSSRMTTPAAGSADSRHSRKACSNKGWRMSNGS